MLTIFHHHERHTGCDQASHWSYGTDAVTGLQGDPASLDECLSGSEVRSPAFILYGPEQGATHGATHGFPGDRWPGVQHRVLPELRQHLARGTQGYEVRPSRINAL